LISFASFHDVFYICIIKTVVLNVVKNPFRRSNPRSKFPIPNSQFLIFLCVLSVEFLSCSQKPDETNIFRYNESQGIENLDPVMASNYAALWPLIQVCEGLVEFDPQMNLKPLLAESYSISEDGLVYTFKLRPNVRFHDDDCFPNRKGRTVKSFDFKYCFERVCDPRTKTRGAWVFRDRIAASDLRADTSAEISGIQCPDSLTLVITLTKPFAPFLSILTMAYAFVYPQEAVEYYKENFGYHPVGTGPFRFVKWDFDRELLFEQNPDYWSTLPALEGFRVSFIRSSETAFLDFLEGKLDYYDPSPEVLDQITDTQGLLLPRYNFELIRQPWLNTVYLAVQMDEKMPGGKNNILSNAKLRRAIAHALDRRKLAEYVLRHKGKPAENGPIPPGMPGFSNEVSGYGYDRQKSLTLLEEAGYPNGKGLSLTLTISNEETQKLTGEAIQGQLKEIGIDVKLDFIQGSVLRSAQVGGELPFWRANWGADYFDPENFMALFYSKNKTPNGPNYTHYSNPEADSLYELALRLTDFSKRAGIYNDMERIVLEDCPWILLYYNEIIYLKSPKLKGLYIDGLNNLILKYTSLEL
jgi:oligopeptide transport system substrate-binding protein